MGGAPAASRLALISADDQHLVARFHLCLADRLQRGDTGDRRRGRLLEGQVRRFRRELARLDAGVLRERAIAGAIDRIANSEPSHVLADRVWALLHLIDFDEPFGYSVVEAMASGTPVIAYARGSMPEIVDDGITGFLVADIDGAIDAVDAADELDRSGIRHATIARFDVATMIDRYVDVYRTILDGAAIRSRTARSTTSSRYNDGKFVGTPWL